MSKVIGKGTVLQESIATVFTAIAQIISLDLPEAETETVEADTLDNANAGIPYEATGRTEGGSVSGELYFDPTLAGHQQFTDHLLDELNIKKVTILESADDRCTVELRPNKKLLGAKYGKLVPAITKALADADAKTLAAKLSAGEPASVSADGQEIMLEPAEVVVTKSYGDDWAAAEGRGTIVLLDKRITTELKHEGIARDIVRNVQNLRKTAELNIEDRIELSLQTESPQVRAAIDAFKDYIANETLALRITADPLADGAASVDAQIEGDILNIALRRIPGGGEGA
ncbi:MAG: hypothetical protein IID37_03150 [Planctomycetes bacterium]|nr:hypothetical protein [Planctomycetota bacterium]